MRTVVETTDFIRDAMKIWSEAEYDDFVEWIARHPDAGDVIVGTNGARKIRWSRRGAGKSGGVRVIYSIGMRREQCFCLRFMPNLRRKP
ncbi:hypothetical protein AGMMS50256_12890 [Betaproteobacteria bacterium]|nr:hypothetical protein AGMMS50256_12890 [Betaproteobacteria bacterium]